MANTIITLTHSSINDGLPIQVYCTSVKIGLNKKNERTPNANYDQFPADVQSLSRDNLKYTLSDVKVGYGDLSYRRLLELFALENDDANPLKLNIKYGNKITTVSTGSISSGSSSLTVEDAESFSTGDTIYVSEAGSDGSDLVSTISSISEDVITLDDNASSSVTNSPIRIMGGHYLVDSLNSTFDIPVTIDGTTSINLSTIDSKDSSIPTGTINLIEVKDE